MIERIVENWLTNVNEKSFQIPFCQMLIGEGYQVIHLSRHGSFEEGKDVLAIAPDGIPCAFQLKGVKGKKISQTEWSTYHDQIIRLIETPIKHPSIGETLDRRVYFVTNGELDEEVRVEITNQNPDRVRRKLPELKTILKGELTTRFNKLHTNLWPIELQSERDLLELYLADGTGYLDKAKFAGLMESIILSIDDPKQVDGQRLLASAALFASFALYPFSQVENYIAVIEGWTIFIAYITSFIEKYRLTKKYWGGTIQIAEEAIEIALINLWEEVKNLEYIVAGDALADQPFYKGRLTWITGYISSLVLWQNGNISNVAPPEDFSDFLLKNLNELHLWGEAAIPQFLSIVWALRNIDHQYLSDRLLYSIYQGTLAKTISSEGLPDPYHNLGEVTLAFSNLSDLLVKENFSGRSYYLDSLIQLLARYEYRGVLAEDWKKITSVQFSEFEPENSWQFCFWHCEDGVLHVTLPKKPQSWQNLFDHSMEVQVHKIPSYFVSNPVLLLIFLMVFPHRIRPDVIKFLDEAFVKNSLMVKNCYKSEKGTRTNQMETIQ
ncbi:MAG: hypothetical protein HPY85_15825 [Anaerolineae bacterium]|nr:hypothetical protein [Anaerolineae bacterium]